MAAYWSFLRTVICALYFVILCGDVRAVVPSSITLSSSYHINDKKPLGLVNDRFLSYTLEPDVLMHVSDCGEVNGSSDFIRTLLPAYLRIAGPDSNKLYFQDREKDKSQAIAASTSTENSKREKILLTGPQWLKFIDFVKNTTGLRIIVSLSGNFEDENSDPDLTNALEFINYSSKHHLDLDWELGYELQRTGRYDGGVLGRDIAKLRKVLDIFPRYQNSLILGPGITSLENRAELGFVRSYLSEAEDSLNVFTLHYDFSKLEEDDNIYEKLSPIFNKMDSYLWVKEGVPKALRKGVVNRKSIWLSESENKDRSCSFSETLSFIQRLGAAAKLGVSVYLRKPHIESLSEPTSEYWAAALFKSLVGKMVLDAKFVDGNNTKVFVFSHCTRVLTPSENFIINPSIAYEPGAITLYGINTGSEWSRLYIKLNSRHEQIVHQYILTEEKGSYTRKTLFNKQEIRLSDENELPIVSPRIRETSNKYVLLPPKSIFFLVLPYGNSRTCMTWSTEESHNVDKMNKSSFVPSEDETSIVGKAEHLEDGESDDGVVYVSYPRKQGSSTTSPFRKPEPKNTKYITYSEDTWLSPLPDQLKEIFYTRQSVDDDTLPKPTTSHSKKERRNSKIENYRIITNALLGKRNISQNFSHEPHSRSRRSIVVHTDDEEGKDNGNQKESDEDAESGANLMHMLTTGNGDELNWNTGESDYFRRRRDDTADVANLATMTLSPSDGDFESLATMTLSPFDGDFESLSSLTRAFPFDDDANEETIRFIRGISIDVPNVLDENPSIRLHRKSRKSKLFKQSVPSGPINQSLEATLQSFISTHVPPDVEQTPITSVQTVEPSTIISTPDSTTQAEKSDILGDAMMEHNSEMTTIVAETTTVADTPMNTRSMVESLDGVPDTAKQMEEDAQFELETAATVKPYVKSRKGPVSPIKRKPGYMSTSSTNQPTKRSHYLFKSTSPPPVPTAPTKRRHKIKPTDQPIYSTASTKRGRASKTTSQPSFSTRKNAIRPLIHSDKYEPRTVKNLHEMREINREKLKEILEANLAIIQQLKEERMRRKSARVNAGSRFRTKRDVESIDKLKKSLSRLARANHQRIHRSLFDDAFDRAEHMSKDLSTNVKDLYSDMKDNTREKVRSLINWMEKKYKEIRRELVSTRSKHDVTKVSEHIRDYNAKIQQGLAEIRARLRSRFDQRSVGDEEPQLSFRNPVQPLFQSEPVHAGTLEDSAYTWHAHTGNHHSAPIVTLTDVDRELTPPPTLGEHTDSLDYLVPNSRSVRSLVSNEIIEDDEFLTGNEIPRATSTLDSFEENMVDAKLRVVTPQLVTKKPKKDRDFQDFIRSHSLLKNPPDGLDEDICDRNGNIFAYLWCKCKEFFSVMIRVFDANNKD